jgi:hypothetical protein
MKQGFIEEKHAKLCYNVYLTKSHKDARKRWAKDHEEWKKVDWE